MSKNPTKVLAGRIGGLTKAARYRPEELTAAATEGFHQRFMREVDPDGILPIEERTRRAEAAKKAHMARLAMKSAESRRRKRGAA